jgi:hypothetical protein
VAVADALAAAQARVRQALSRHDFSLAQFAIHRCDRHDADDVILLCLVGAVDDVTGFLESQHSGGGARPITAGLDF